MSSDQELYSSKSLLISVLQDALITTVGTSLTGATLYAGDKLFQRGLQIDLPGTLSSFPIDIVNITAGFLGIERLADNPSRRFAKYLPYLYISHVLLSGVRQIAHNHSETEEDKKRANIITYAVSGLGGLGLSMYVLRDINDRMPLKLLVGGSLGFALPAVQGLINRVMNENNRLPLGDSQQLAFAKLSSVISCSIMAFALKTGGNRDNYKNLIYLPFTHMLTTAVMSF